MSIALPLREPDGRTRARAAPEPTLHGRVYLDVLAAYDRAGIAHCVLRPSTSVASVEDGHDLDVLVDPHGLARAIDLAIACAARHGAVLWDRGREGARHDLHFHVREASGLHTFIALDLHTAETCFGVPFLRAREILEHSIVADGVRRAAPAQSACIDLFGPFLSGGVMPERYVERLRRVLQADACSVEGELRRWFGARLGLATRRTLERSEDPATECDRGQLLRALLLRASVRAPLAALGTFASFAWAMICGAWLKPRGRMIAFLGTDGSGKSTLAAAVQDRLQSALGRERVALFHLRPGLFPQLNALAHGGRTTYTLADMSTPHRAKPAGALGSTLRALYYALDWTLGYAVRVLPRRRRSSIVLFDRYVDDYLVDPRRSRIRAGAPFLATIVRACPRPDRIVVCTATFDTVRERKRELEPGETARQLAAYEALAAAAPKTLLVDTGASLEACVDTVLDFVFSEAHT